MKNRGALSKILFFVTLALGIAYPPLILRAETALIIEAPTLLPGDTWVFKSSQGALQVRKFLKEDNGLLVFEVIHTSPGGKPAPYTFFLTRDLSIVRVVKGDGTEHRRFEPHALGLRFPLHLGKKWDERVQRFDQGKPGPVSVGNCQVPRFEEVEVAPGRLRSSRVECQAHQEGDSAKVFRYIHWYSPEAKTIVKIWEADPTGRESTFELLEFRAAERTKVR